MSVPDRSSARPAFEAVLVISSTASEATVESALRLSEASSGAFALLVEAAMSSVTVPFAASPSPSVSAFALASWTTPLSSIVTV